MNSKINKGRLQFNDENYEKALNYFDEVDEDDEDYDYVLIFKISCLMELERYDKALFLIDSLLGEDSGDELLLYEKIRCHIALDEKIEALDTLKEFEKVIDKEDKQMMLDVARFYKVLGEFNKALIFCNGALSVDDEFEDALFEKSVVAIALNKDEIVNNCANKLLNIVGYDRFRVLPVFLLKLYLGRFRDCMDIVDNLDGEFKSEILLMLKMVVFNQLSLDLGVNVHIEGDDDISVGQAIDLLFDYDENGVDEGIINNTSFVIM
ncbi:MAG: bacterial transcriptional activator domain-containing protein [Methanobrevibacter sp.]|uniref:tetratricopeptide repeat protein n=1 Tax=Methanobrevibacter sp. TaxID=66852 RepID=UPI0025CC3DE1|nr:tetratricopeptide repeat protein [Methanobrevibacter sp.]MBQ6098340.1 bacterial transcriptional activator domain-containing protein [Methanobrevibacter sp.]